MLSYWFAIERIFNTRWYRRYHWYHCYDDVYWLWHPLAGMLDNLAEHRKLRSAVSQSDWHKVSLVDSWSVNRWSHNWRSKMHGKMKHSWSTISSEDQVNRRSANQRSNLIWLVIEKPDLRSRFFMHIWCSIKLIFDQLWDLIRDHLNDLLVTNGPLNLPSSWWPNIGQSSQIRHGNLQFVAYLHQKHRFTSPVRTTNYALK